MKTSSSGEDSGEERAGEVLARLKGYYRYQARRGDPFRVLISTILSQRTRDENTSRAADALFSVFDTPEKLAHADVGEVEALVRPSGFYHVKARRIVTVAQQIVNQFEGKVPDNVEELLTLEGVGRKTANCVLVYGFGSPAIPVDVHVHRIAHRLHLVSAKTPGETEKALTRLYREEDWISLNQLLVSLGRDICRPRNPRCERCFLLDICPTGLELTR